MSTETSAQTATRVSLLAPITGVLIPIEQVPDPVFAQKMVGEGVSIDPLSNSLVAPCDGEVVHIHPAAHALTIRSADGLEVLTHIGLDTVHMKGEGFTVKVKVGDQVHAGDELITFDLDTVATNAKSLLTQMVIANSDRLSDFAPGSGVVTAGQSVVAVATLAAVEAAEGVAKPGRTVTSDAVLVPNPVGLHARPAAVLSNLAAQYESDVSLKRGDDRANAKSVMAIMAMEVRYGDKVQVIAYGPDAEQAVAELASQIAAGLGEEGVTAIAEAGAEPEAAPVPAPVAPAPRRRSEDPNVLLGVAASPGLGVGTVVQIRHEDFEVAEDSNDRHRERRRLNDAIDRSMVQLEALEDRLSNQADADKAAIFAAHRGDPARPRAAGPGDERDRQGQDRGIRLAQGLPAVCRRAGEPQERGARRARRRRARRRPAGAAGDHRAAPREGRARRPVRSWWPRTSPRRTPSPSTPPRWSVSARRPAGPPRTWRSSRGPSTSRRSPGSTHSRSRSSRAAGSFSTAPRARCG